jgi:hypothetical protein
LRWAAEATIGACCPVTSAPGVPLLTALVLGLAGLFSNRVEAD